MHRGMIIDFSGNIVICGDCADSRVISYINNHRMNIDTYLVDPPFDNKMLYNVIPKNENDYEKLIILSSPRNYLDGIFIAIENGWTPSFEFIWDGCVSHNIDNSPLLRHKSAKCFGSKYWNKLRGVYIDDDKPVNHLRKNYTHLQTVYKENFAKSDKIHPHEKPINWLSGIFGGIGSKHVLDYFAGSGNALFAAIDSGNMYTGIELDEDRCDAIIDQIKNKYPYSNIEITKMVE